MDRRTFSVKIDDHFQAVKKWNHRRNAVFTCLSQKIEWWKKSVKEEMVIRRVVGVDGLVIIEIERVERGEGSGRGRTPYPIPLAAHSVRLLPDPSPTPSTLSIPTVTNPFHSYYSSYNHFFFNGLFHHSIFWERHVKTAFLRWFHFFTAWKWSSILTENVRLPICNIL